MTAPCIRGNTHVSSSILWCRTLRSYPCVWAGGIWACPHQLSVVAMLKASGGEEANLFGSYFIVVTHSHCCTRLNQERVDHILGFIILFLRIPA